MRRVWRRWEEFVLDASPWWSRRRSRPFLRSTTRRLAQRSKRAPAWVLQHPTKSLSRQASTNSQPSRIRAACPAESVFAEVSPRPSLHHHTPWMSSKPAGEIAEGDQKGETGGRSLACRLLVSILRGTAFVALSRSSVSHSHLDPPCAERSEVLASCAPRAVGRREGK